MQINKSLFPVGSSYTAVKKLEATLDKLQVQLATQEKASTLSELGRDRVFDLNLRSRLSRLESFQASIQTVGLRLDFLDNSVSRLDEIEAEARQSLTTSGAGPDGITMAAAQAVAYSRLDEVLTVLNGEINGRHVFAGKNADARPVVTANELLNGSGAKAGLKQIITERGLADTGGAAGTGRLTTSFAQLSAAVNGGTPNEVVLSEPDFLVHPHAPVIAGVTTTSANVTITPAGGTPGPATVAVTGLPADGEQIAVTVQRPDGSTEVRTFTAVTGTPAAPGEFQIGADADATAANFQAAFGGHFHANTFTLAEDGAHPFGLKLDGVTTNSAAISVIPPTAGPPSVLSLRVDNQPLSGEQISFTFTLPDNTTAEIKLNAIATGPAEPGQFVIGADADATAANIGAALGERIAHLRDTKLSAASSSVAAENFINGRGQTAQRVDGPPFETATGLIAADPNTTVIWYKGEDTAGNPRATATARVDESTVVNYGIQANEQGLADLVRALGVMAAQSHSPTSSPVAVERYQELASRQASRLSEINNGQAGSIEVIALELGIARTTIGAAKDRHDAYEVQLDTMLTEIEAAPVEEVAMQLLAVRTRLEASYQTMSRLSELTLVNFLR